MVARGVEDFLNELCEGNTYMHAPVHVAYLSLCAKAPVLSLTLRARACAVLLNLVATNRKLALDHAESVAEARASVLDCAAACTKIQPLVTVHLKIVPLNT